MDYLELLFGFDLECSGNHDDVIYQALYEGTPLANLLYIPGYEQARALDVQPVFGCTLSEKGDLQAYFEVKTRPRSRRGSSRSHREDPISLFVTVRQYGPIEDVDDLQGHFDRLAHLCEELATDRLVPDLLMPISRQITNSSA